MAEDPRDEFITRIEASRERWRRLSSDVGEERMELPGAMGDWSFKDLASHLAAWRGRTIDRLGAAARGEPAPPPPWYEAFGDQEVEDDPVNDWIHEHTRDRTVAEALAAVESTYDGFEAAVSALSIEVVTDPTRFDWLDGQALVGTDPGGHLAGHESSVRRWLEGLG